MRIGLSVSGPNQSATVDQAIGIETGGMLLFDSVQATWNLLENSVGQSLRSAHEAGLNVIVKEGLANGRLTARNVAPDFAEQLSSLKQIASERETTVDALALAAVAGQNWVTTVLSGASTVEHLQSNLAASNVDWNDELAKRLEPLVEAPDEYWSRRSELAWN